MSEQSDATAVMLKHTTGAEAGAAEALAPFADPQVFSYTITTTAGATQMTVTGSALIALVGSPEITLQKQS